MNILRIFSFTILMGVALSGNSNSENLPMPIPIDFGVNYGMRSDSTFCDSCNQEYDAEVMGASCCDEATEFNSIFTCDVLETTYLWNCSGCGCDEDDGWTTDFGCMDDGLCTFDECGYDSPYYGIAACNLNSDAIWDDGSCSFTDGMCQSCVEGEVVDNDDDGDNVCNEQEILGCQDETACNYNPDATDDGSCETAMENYDCDGNCVVDTDCNDECGGTAIEDECGVCGGDGSSCTSWTELTAEGGDNQITLSWYTVESARTSFMNRDGCEDDSDICIWNSWYSDYDNQQECEANGGIWGSYLEYYGTSCSELLTEEVGCDDSILYWMVSDLCPESCGVCLEGCTDMDACNYNPDATDDDGSCVDPEENYDCDGNCIVEIDCNDECGGTAGEDECGVCNGDGSSCSGSAHLEIQNVNLTDGTLDVYMTNDVAVAGFEFYLSGMTITNLSGGTANEYFDFVEFHAPIGKILGISFSGVSIPQGDFVLLTTVSFIEFEGDSICFVDDDACANSIEVCEDCTCENNVPVVHIISDTNGNEIPSTWGDCFEDNNNLVYGCTYETACNYNAYATADDGSCVDPEENYDCDGNCIIELDCNDECGGTAIEDECGVCGGEGGEFTCWDGSFACNAPSCPVNPDDYSYNVYRDGTLIESGLIITSFTDTELGYSETHCYTVTYNYGGGFESEHSNEACAETNPEPVIPGCTDDDACNYNPDATVDDESCEYAEENYNCDGNCIAEIDECDVCGGDGSEIECWDGELVCNESDCSAGIDYTLILDNHHNLVSFYALPDDASIGGITSSLGNNALSVITEGSSAINFDGIWSGSLIEITPENGYWISISNFPNNLSVIGFDMDSDRMYELHEGPNLISFPDSGSADLSSAIPDDVEHLFTAIIAEGNSAFNTDDGWAGSLTGFQGGAGYWVIVEEDFAFSYNTEDLLARSVHSFSEKLPDEVGFNVAQSSRQAFYYVDGIKLNQGGVEVGDWILSYKNGILAGIRQWKGDTIDIPTMGSAGDMVTAGYFNEGDVPTFKLLKQSTGKIITLEGNIPRWSDNGIFILGELYEKQQIPKLFVLSKAYPNPFNPITTIGFGVPNKSEILVEIYNLYGKQVETLVNESMQAGYKSVVWNADNYSSGLYFVKLSAQSLKGNKYSRTQKLMLVK